MRTTPATILLCAAFVTVGAPSLARGSSEVGELIDMARESLDLAEYEEARDFLTQALETLTELEQERSSQGVEVQVLLGVVHGGGLGDEEAALLAFTEALKIDANARLPGELATPALQALVERAREELFPTVSCASVRGLHHEAVAAAVSGEPVRIHTLVGASLADLRVDVLYQSPGAGGFDAVTMEPEGECGRVATIPAEATGGGVVRYYLSAFTDQGKLAAMAGHQDTPFVIALSRQAAPEPDESAAGGGSGEEVPDHLRGTQPRKKSGCAGCGAGGSAGLSGLLLLAGAGALLVRRRRSC